MIGRGGLYYRDRRGILQNGNAVGAAWRANQTQTTLLLASAFLSASLSCFHSCRPMWSTLASPQGPCLHDPLKPSSTLRPATLSPASLSHMSTVGAVTKVRSTESSPASTAELRGPSLVSGVQISEGRVIGGVKCQKVSAVPKRCLL